MTIKIIAMKPNEQSLRERAKALGLHGLVKNWPVGEEAISIEALLAWEEKERAHRSLERRIAAAKLDRFKTLEDFDWKWPKQVDRAAYEDLLSLEFVKDATNIIFIGPNGVGKTLLMCNLAYQALYAGYRVIFNTANQILNELASIDSDSYLRRRFRYYASVDLLCLDELGYMSYNSPRHADLFFELINRRYEKRSTIITTNKQFTQWGEIFGSMGSMVSTVDRLVHHSVVMAIEGDSYRLKEANERAAANKNKGTVTNTQIVSATKPAMQQKQKTALKVRK
jgi:DNA replication protein DnaC